MSVYNDPEFSRRTIKFDNEMDPFLIPLKDDIAQLSRDLASLTDKSSAEFHKQFTRLATDVLSIKDKFKLDEEVFTLSVIGGMILRNPGTLPYPNQWATQIEWREYPAKLLKLMVDNNPFAKKIRSPITTSTQYSVLRQLRQLRQQRVATMTTLGAVPNFEVVQIPEASVWANPLGGDSNLLYDEDRMYHGDHYVSSTNKQTSKSTQSRFSKSNR